MGRKRKVPNSTPSQGSPIPTDVITSNGATNNTATTPLGTNANSVPHSQHNTTYAPTSSFNSFTCNNGSNQDVVSQPQGNHNGALPSSVPISQIGHVQSIPTFCPSELQWQKQTHLNTGLLHQQDLQQPFQGNNFAVYSPNPDPRSEMPIQEQKRARQQHINPMHQLSHQAPRLIPQHELVMNYGPAFRRLMMYQQHQRGRPADNNIHYWRRFVPSYYAPYAKKKWCFSLYPPKALHPWLCALCGSRLGRGYEACWDSLPKLYHAKFSDGIIEERIYLPWPQECKLPSGCIVLDEPKASIITVHDRFHVVHEGHLQIMFTHDLKILCWEFCTVRHQHFLASKWVVPQAEKFIHASRALMSAIRGSTANVSSEQHLIEIQNKTGMVGYELVKAVQPRALTKWGFLEHHARQLDVSNAAMDMAGYMLLRSQTNSVPLGGFNRSSSTAMGEMNGGSNGDHQHTRFPGRLAPNPSVYLQQQVGHQMQETDANNMIDTNNDNKTTTTTPPVKPQLEEEGNGGLGEREKDSVEGLHLSEELIGYLGNNFEAENGNDMSWMGEDRNEFSRE